MKRSDLVKKSVLTLMSFALYCITIATYIHALSLLLNQLGAQMLPLVLIVVSLVVIGHSLLNSFLSGRFASNRVFVGTILFFIVNYVVLLAMGKGIFGAGVLTGSFEHTFYFMVVAALMLWIQELTVTHFISSLLTPLQAKSYLPVIYSFMSAGVVVGAFFAVPYREYHEMLGIGTIPLVGLALVLLLMVAVSKVFQREIAEGFSNTEPTPLLKSLKESAYFVFRESRLFRSLALVIILFVGLHLLIEFKFKTVMSHTFGHETLTEMLGYVYVVAYSLLWIMSSFAVKRVLFRFGVSNLLLFYPISVAIVLGIATLIGLNYLAVIAVLLTVFMSHFSYYNICTSQILSIVPKRLHESVFFFIRGFLFAFALLIFSTSLLLYSYDISLEPTINTAVIAILLVLIIGMLIRQKGLYFHELKANLFKNDTYLKLRSIDLLAEEVSRRNGEDHLRRMLGMETEREVKARVICSLGVIGNYQTIVDLTKTLLEDADPKIKVEAIHAINQIIKASEDLNKVPVTKHYLLRTYEDVLLSDVPAYVKSEIISGLKYFDLEDVISFLEHHLQDDSVHVQRNVIRTMATFGDRGVIPYLEPFLDGDVMALTAEAIVGLWQFDQMRIVLLPRLTALLKMRKRAAVVSSLYVIGSLKAVWEREYVLKKMKSRVVHVRMYALITMVQLGEFAYIDELVAMLLKLAKKGDTREMDFALAWYRRSDEKTKAMVIRKIQDMKEKDAKHFIDAFQESKYSFGMELTELSEM